MERRNTGSSSEVERVFNRQDTSIKYDDIVNKFLELYGTRYKIYFENMGEQWRNPSVIVLY